MCAEQTAGRGHGCPIVTGEHSGGECLTGIAVPMAGGTVIKH
jgi:hypothetical protein